MVTKLFVTNGLSAYSLILAKIHMVTKHNEKHQPVNEQSYSSKNPYGNKTSNT